MDTVSWLPINFNAPFSVNIRSEKKDGQGERTGKTPESRGAPSDPALMRAGVQFISCSFALSLSLHELLSHRVLRKAENVQEEDVQPECFEHRDAPGRIFALGLRGNRSDIKPLQRRQRGRSGVTQQERRIWKVDLIITD